MRQQQKVQKVLRTLTMPQHIAVTYSPAQGPQPVGVYVDHQLLTYEQLVAFTQRLGTNPIDFADKVALLWDEIIRGVAWQGTRAELKQLLKK